MTETATTEADPRSADPDRVDPARLVLAVLWLVLLVTALVAGARESTLQDLEAGLKAGSVRTVEIAGKGLPANAFGESEQTIRWRDGLVRRTTTVGLVVPEPDADEDLDAAPDMSADPGAGETGWTYDGGRHGSVVRTRDMGAHLTARYPGLTVERRPWQTELTTTVRGWALPGWCGLVLLVGVPATLWLLVGRRQPLRATRWAWFWLIFVVPPIGLVAFCLLSAPAPGIPRPRDPSRRLTGPLAFLLALVLDAMVVSVLPL